MTVSIMLAIALLPAIALMIFIYLQDNHEKEPIGLVLGIFGLGILSVIPAMILEWVADKIIGVTFGGAGLFYYAVTAFFGVGIIEEGVKFLAAYMLTWRNKHFNYKFDGIVYCLFGSMGFAATENVMYLFQMYVIDHNEVVGMGIQRGLLAIPAHAMCAIFMGYYYGNARYAKSFGDRAACRKFMIKGFLIASSLHAFYDFCLFTGRVLFVILFYIFVVVADILTIIRIVKARKENQKMYVAPQYRGYWAGPAANPYQPYGGYQAPTYGNYNYGDGAVGMQPIQQQPVSNSYQPQVVRQDAAYQPQQVNTGMGSYQPQQANPAMGGYQPQQANPAMGSYQPQQVNPGMGAYQPQQANTGNGSYQPQQMNQQANFQQIIPQSFRNQLVYCPVCSATNNFNAFNCTECGASLHEPKRI
ncbi:MAG: PrsW family intramembrane metalloprotease [Eubacterium sp.]|nr:PrsW family intramembrane metalloprotease [Eubacterium sp.]